MIITYLGEQFFKISQGEMVLAFNPVSKEAKSEVSARFGADIALVSTDHNLFNGIEQLSFGDRMPLIIDGPGDYEVKEIFIKGAISNALIADKKYVNTIYSFMLDGINVAFLGALADTEISKDTNETIGSPDIVFVPIGGKNLINKVSVLDPKTAAKFALSFEPKMIIPMSYDTASLKLFLKEVGEENAPVLDKLTLKRKDLDGKEGEVVVLKTI